MLFLLVAFTVVFGVHLYLWVRLVRDTTTKGVARRVGTVTIVLLDLLILGGLFFGRLARPDTARWVAWPAYLWLATMFYLLVLLLVLEVPRLALRLTWARRSAPAPVVQAEAGPGAEPEPAAEPAAGVGSGPDHGRRLLLARGLAVAAGITAVGTVGYGVTEAMGPPRIDRVRIGIAKLPRRLDGLRIALVSDIHLGPLLGRPHTERVVRMINNLEADLVAVVGDLVDGSVAELGAAAEPLADLRARFGSYFVTGNHEYFSGYAEWITEVDSLGLRVLENERVEIDGLDLAGVNDVTGAEFRHGPDFAAALDDRDENRPVVLLAHQPVQVRDAARYGVDLQLSGHTHGGQIQPFGAIVRLQQPVLSGLHTIDGTKLYVTDGAGFWGPPVRVGAPPQISVVELRAP